MERTKILYKHTNDGRIEIVDIQGVSCDLPEKYLEGEPRYTYYGKSLSVSSEHKIMFEQGGLTLSTYRYCISAGAVFTEEAFSRLIATMKAARDRLIRICNSNNDFFIKT